MSHTYENLAHTDDMPLDLLRLLIADNVLPESCDPAITQADWDAFHADMMATPMSLPTDAEILAMAESQGLVGLPF